MHILRLTLRLLFALVPILGLSDSYGQIRGYEFTRADLKGFKSITTRTNYYGGDSTSYRSVYTINSVGDIVRSEDYDGHTLTNWKTYQYYDNGLLKYEESHGQFFNYDESTGKDIARISEDTYHGTLFEYNGDLLVKETHINCFDGSKSYPT